MNNPFDTLADPYESEDEFFSAFDGNPQNFDEGSDPFNELEDDIEEYKAILAAESLEAEADAYRLPIEVPTSVDVLNEDVF